MDSDKKIVTFYLRWLGPRIKSARDRLDLTQVYVAEQLKVSTQTIQNWEIGEFAPSAKHIEALLSVLETTYEELGDFTLEYPGAAEMEVVLTGTDIEKWEALRSVPAEALPAIGMLIGLLNANRFPQSEQRSGDTELEGPRVDQAQ